MKKLLRPLLLVLAFQAGFASAASAQARPRAKAKRAFAHTAGTNNSKANKARFRRENIRPTIDLNPHSLEKSKTVKAPKPYKFSKGI